jgi:hypothetical protein
MANSIFNKYLNKSIFEKYIDPTDVLRDLYRRLVTCINTTPSSVVNGASEETIKEYRSNLLYIVKHLISNNRNIYNSGKLIGELNLHMIEKKVSFEFSNSSNLYGSKVDPPKWGDDFLKLFQRIILPDSIPFTEWDDHKIKDLSQKSESDLRKLVRNYLKFNSKIKFGFRDEFFIESLVIYCKMIIAISNLMKKENKFNYRQFVITIAYEYVINWKNLRELIK